MTKTAHTFDELLASSRVQPDDAPGTAAALLWGRIADAHQVPRESLVSQLGVVDRVVLVLLDVALLSPTDVAHHLNTNVHTVLAAHGTARARVGLPSPGSPTCTAWDGIRATHRDGDPAVIEALTTHVASCRSCTDGRGAGSTRTHRSARRVALAGTPALAGVLGAVPALAATVAVAAAVTAASIAVAPTSTDGPQDVTPIPFPIVVDSDPGLPSDSGPSGGVRQPGQPLLEQGIPAAELDEAPTSELPAPGDSGTNTGVPPVVGDAVDDAVDDVTDTVQDVTDTVQDTVDDVVTETPSVPETQLDELAPSTESFGRLRESLLP